MDAPKYYPCRLDVSYPQLIALIRKLKDDPPTADETSERDAEVLEETAAMIRRRLKGG